MTRRRTIQTRVDYKLIGSRIRQARQNEKLSQMDMAALIDVSITHISMVENGRKKVSLEMIARISDALGVTVDELIGGSRNTADSEYLTQIGMQLEGCSDDEKRLVCEMACAVRKTLKGNRLL